MSPNAVRTLLEDTLTFIADPDAQRRAQAQAPGVEVSMELMLRWEDAYRPEALEFAWAFDAMQCAVLESFHAVFLEVRNTVHLDPPPLARFMTTVVWRKYSEAARAALHGLQSVRRAA